MTNRGTALTILGGVLVLAVALTGRGGLEFDGPTAAPSAIVVHADLVTAPAAPDGPLPSSRRGSLGAADGVLSDGASPFDAALPALAKLDPDLLAALRQAASAATRAGVKVVVDSGWRSPAYQEQLLRDAIAEYGSAAEAARWVASPETSPHVAGEAVDIGGAAAIAWLARHGAAFGLCQIYRNEPWHFELRPDATGDGCPPMYADATRDPRLR